MAMVEAGVADMNKKLLTAVEGRHHDRKPRYSRKGVRVANFIEEIPTGPAAPPKAEAGPRRGSDAAQCSDRSRVSLSTKEAVHIHNVAIEDCAKIATRKTFHGGHPYDRIGTGAGASAGMSASTLP